MRTQILKSLLTLFIVSTFFYSHAQEQGTKELTLGYGTATSNEIQGAFEDLTLIILTVGTVGSKDHTYSGASYINFSYAIKDDFTFGVEAAYERVTKNIYVFNTKIA